MKDIEKKLRQEIKDIVLLPDVKEKLRGKIDFTRAAEGAELEARPDKTAAIKVKKVKLMTAIALILALIAAAISLTVYYFSPERGGGGGGIIPPPAIAGNVYVRISINPSVELEVDENNIVIAQRGLNKDGVTLLYKKSFIGLTASAASASVISSAETYGYLENAREIKLNVVSNDDKKAAAVSDAIIAEIAPRLPDKSVVTPRDDKQLAEEAARKGVSAEKWQLIKIAVNHGHSENELIDKSVEDLLELVEDTDELEEYAKEIAGDIEAYIEDVIAAARGLIATLETTLEDEGVSEEKLPADVLSAIKEYAEYFDGELLEDIDEYTYEDISDLIEELKDTVKDYEESLMEFKEDGDDISDILEDCLDSYKKWQNRQDKQ